MSGADRCPGAGSAVGPHPADPGSPAGAGAPGRSTAAGDPGPGSPGSPVDGPALPYDPELPVTHRMFTPWTAARQVALAVPRQLRARKVPLGEQALGAALARDLVALTDLPPFDTSAMDGWAVAGAGPWRLAGQVLAGQRTLEKLPDGHAVRVATGAELPTGAVAVVRSEHGATELRADGEWLRVAVPYPAPVAGQEVRRRGQECRGGEELLPAGTRVTPAVLGLAAATGHDELAVVARPRVEVLVLGDELLADGAPRDGRVRDALGPMLPPWLRELGAEVTAVRSLADDMEALRSAVVEAVATRGADLVVTTGGTASGPRDHVHGVLARVGARLCVDGVTVRPGHPMLLAVLPCGPYEEARPARHPATLGPDGRWHAGEEPGAGPTPSGNDAGAVTGTVAGIEGRGADAGDGAEAAAGAGPSAGAGDSAGSGPQPGAARSYFVGLPGNPLAAVAGVLTLVAPLLRTLGGHTEPASYTATLTGDIHGHDVDTRLVPVVYDGPSTARPLRFSGSAMLRGLAAAHGMAVVPPGGAQVGQQVTVLGINMPGSAWGRPR